MARTVFRTSSSRFWTAWTYRLVVRRSAWPTDCLARIRSDRSAPGAGRAFFEGDFSPTGAQSPPTDLAMLRVVQDAGSLGRVQVTATRLTAEVNGTSLDGCELELFGVTGRASQPVSSRGK